MRQSYFPFLCILALFSAATAAPSDPTAAYLAARDRYIAEFNGHLGYKGHLEGMNDTRPVQVFAEVERLLRVAVPVWNAPGFPATGEINLGVFDDPYTMGFGVLNGLVYRSGGASVIMTNRALLMRWLADHNRRDRVKVPVSIPAVFRSDNF